MIAFEPETVEFKNERDVAEARDIASGIASAIGFDNVDCAEVALAVSEIAGNALKFAGKGAMTIGLPRNGKGLEIIVQDNGQGIRNIRKSMEEKYSSVVGSLGVGLNAAQRAMDELAIRSRPGQGTTVIMKKYLPIPEEEIEYGIISLNDERYPVNGDAWVIKEFEGDKVLLAVIDGAGNGFNANKVANFVKDIIEQNYKSALTTIATRCHKRMRKKFDVSKVRNCVMSLLLLKPRSLEYLGVGDIDSRVMGVPQKIYLQNQRGSVGDIRLPELKVRRHRYGSNSIIIMCSDGINPRFTGDDLPLNQSAQHIAVFIMENYHRQYGDATVLVAKRKR